ncbi:GNAT family N-acetyltransferase [bacterium]|nr:GNAT family N-acetyltransferase [bacterium]
MAIRRYNDADAGRISEFMHRCFVRNAAFEIRAHSPEYYAWKYSENPWGRPVVWIAEEEDRIAGLMAVVPKSMRIDGRTLLVGESGDTFMDPDAKGKNVFLEMASRVFDDCRHEGFQLIYGTPNPVSYDVVTKLFGYTELFGYRSLIRPLRFEPLIRSRVRSRIISKLVSWPVGMFHQNAYWPRIKHSAYSIEPVEKPDQRLDQIWERLSGTVRCSLVKDRTYVQWRFFDSPESFRVNLIKKGDEAVGYTALKLTPLPGLVCGHIADLTLAAEEKGTPGLWNCLLSELKKLKADFVNTWMLPDHAQTDSMKRFGFITRKKPFWIVMRDMHQTVNGNPAVREPESWMFSQADTDNI